MEEHLLVSNPPKYCPSDFHFPEKKYLRVRMILLSIILGVSLSRSGAGLCFSEVLLPEFFCFPESGTV